MIKMTLMVKQVMMKARWSVHVSVDWYRTKYSSTKSWQHKHQKSTVWNIKATLSDHHQLLLTPRAWYSQNNTSILEIL